jgi:phosphoserine phosphatase RsbU/P
MHDIPRLSDIFQATPTIDAATPTAAVVDLFNGNSDLIAVPIEKDGAFIGIVRKGQLYKALSKAYALDVYNRRPISSLIDKNALSMIPQLDIHSALSALLKVDPLLETDSISIVSEGKCLGMVSVSSLMMNISRNQSRLFQILEDLTIRIRDEVEKAAQIQQLLIPSKVFKYADVELAADLKTCTEVGGDFYDYFLTERNQLGLIVADVSGHGVQAGMVTTAAKASLHTLIRQGVTAPGLLLSKINEAILATTGQALLMTCFVVIINQEDRQIQYANAGHNYPFLCCKCSQSIEMLQSPPSFPLGFESDSSFKENTAAFNPGDTLVLYSDGINECSNGLNDYGYARFKDCLADLAGRPPNDWVEQILLSLAEFRGKEGYDDDISLVVARFEESARLELGLLNAYSSAKSKGSIHD